MSELSGPSTGEASAIEIIRRLTHEYAQCVDGFDLKRLLELWAPDAYFDERPIGRGLTSGNDAIRRFFEADFADRRASGHFMTNHLIDFLESGAARGTCYALVFADFHSSPSLRACVIYTDDYLEVADEWRFKSRTVSLLTPIEFAELPAAPASMGDPA